MFPKLTILPLTLNLTFQGTTRYTYSVQQRSISGLLGVIFRYFLLVPVLTFLQVLQLFT